MNRNTILLVVALIACISFSKAESSNSDDSSKKSSAASANSIPTEKPEAFNIHPDHQRFRYQPPASTRYQIFNTPEQVLGQQLPDVVRKQQYHQHPQHVAMVIIAQPAYVPPHMVPGNGAQLSYIPGNNQQANSMAQQLLHFFHTNPQARYQLLYGNHHQPQQTYIQPVYQPRYQPAINPAIAAAYQGHFPMPQQNIPSEVPSYQPQNYAQHVVHQHSPYQAQVQHFMNQQRAQSQLQRVPQPGPTYHQQAVGQHQQSYQPNSIADIAQQAAQRFLLSEAGSAPSSRGPGGIKTAPAVITGLENFSPEHQAKIKAQLSEQFGAPLQPLPLDGASASKTAMTPSRSYFSNKYYPEEQNEFVPSQQVKSQSSSESDGRPPVTYSKM